MLVKKTLATVATAGLLSMGAMTPASAAPNTNNQSGGAAGLVAAVVNANVQDVRVTVVDGDVNVTLTNLLNNNEILNNVLNDVTVTDVVDVTVVDNVLVVNVLSSSTIAELDPTFTP